MVTGQKKNPCRSCAALLVSSGNDNPRKPHEYLVAVGAPPAGSPARYACLVCNTALVEEKTPVPKWALGE